jgi:hypothetical protein
MGCASGVGTQHLAHRLLLEGLCMQVGSFTQGQHVRGGHADSCMCVNVQGVAHADWCGFNGLGMAGSDGKVCFSSVWGYIFQTPN